MRNNMLYGDSLLLMPELPSKSVDMVCADLPQKITRNAWDVIIPFEPLWEQYNRLIKDNGAIVLFANQPFTSQLIMSNLKMFRYSLVWQKTTPTGFFNAGKMPLRTHEDICVFYKKPPIYNPQKTTGHKPVNSYTKRTGDGSNYGKGKIVSGGGSTERFPTSVLTFATDKQKEAIHPTQKPVALLEWLIKTYTNEGALVLDNCAGSFSTAIACINTNRDYIMMEKDFNEFQKGQNRVNQFLIAA